MKTEKISQIDSDLWGKAKEYFLLHPDAVKFDGHKINEQGQKIRDKDGISQRQHPSFIQDKTTQAIYALEPHTNNPALTGNEGRVKAAIQQDGTLVAAKVVMLDSKNDYDPRGDEAILPILDRFYGSTERLLTHYKTFNQGQANQRNYDKKRYIFQSLISGNNLFDAIYDDKLGHIAHHKNQKNTPKMIGDIPEIDRLITAYLGACVIRELHQNNIIHGDINPTNFMFDPTNITQCLSAIDFSISKQLHHDEMVDIRKINRRSPRYAAPEINNPDNNGDYFYTKAADVHAWGKIMELDLKLPEKYYLAAIQEKKEDRPTIDALADQLRQSIISHKQKHLKTPLTHLFRKRSEPLHNKQDMKSSSSSFAFVKKLKKKLSF